MNFQDLKKIEKADFYIDVAFRRASERVDEIRNKAKGKDHLSKSKQLEITRMEIVKASLTENLKKIIVSFPNIDNLDIFYVELVKCTLDYVALKKSLGSVNWAIKKIEFFFNTYKNKMKRCTDLKLVNKIRREYYGRASSIMKQIKDYLWYLEEARMTMRSYPSIKTSLFTVCIFGFPNVGKSTLLSKLTSASPEIKPYPFTTKTLNLGYINDPKNKIQIIDTPGTLNRVSKMNLIEMQAYLAVRHLASLVIFVFDPTDGLGKQERLLERLKEFKKPVILFMSKSDLAKDSQKAETEKSHKDILTSHEKLKEQILKLARA